MNDFYRKTGNKGNRLFIIVAVVLLGILVVLFFVKNRDVDNTETMTAENTTKIEENAAPETVETEGTDNSEPAEENNENYDEPEEYGTEEDKERVYDIPANPKGLNDSSYDTEPETETEEKESDDEREYKKKMDRYEKNIERLVKSYTRARGSWHGFAGSCLSKDFVNGIDSSDRLKWSIRTWERFFDELESEMQNNGFIFGTTIAAQRPVVRYQSRYSAQPFRCKNTLKSIIHSFGNLLEKFSEADDKARKDGIYPGDRRDIQAKYDVDLNDMQSLHRTMEDILRHFQ